MPVQIKWIDAYLTISPATSKDKIRELFNFIGEIYNDERKVPVTKYGNDNSAFLDLKLLSLTLVNKNNVFIASHEAKTLSSLRILLKIEYYEEDKMSSNYLYDLMKEDVDFSKVTKIKGIMKNSNQKKPLEVVKDYLKRYYKVLVEYLKE